MKKLIKIVLVLTSFMCCKLSFGQEAAQADEAAIISWIQQNAVPITHVKANNGFEDLQALKEILKDVKVVGLGESTHGTREFFQVKHRILEFLVMEMGYTNFAIEAPYFACKPINDFILTGKGDLSATLTGQGYVVWDTEEIAEMIKWMKGYNDSAPEEKKVRFYGVDLAYQEVGRTEVSMFLEKVAPELKAQADSVFRIMAEEEQKWPTKMDQTFQKTMLHAMVSLQDLTDGMLVNKEGFVQKSSLEEFDQAYHNLRVMKQFILANTAALFPPFTDGAIARSLSMAENLIHLVEKAGPEAKFVLWQHNSHIAKDMWNGTTIMGYQLRQQYGDTYYSFALEFGQGSFQTRLKHPDNRLGELKTVSLPAVPIHSMPWYLSQSNMGNIILDFRKPLDDVTVAQWLHTPQKMYLAGWVYDPNAKYIVELDVSRLYDGIIYIPTTTPTRPTPNALKSAAEGKGL